MHGHSGIQLRAASVDTKHPCTPRRAATRAPAASPAAVSVAAPPPAAAAPVPLAALVAAALPVVAIPPAALVPLVLALPAAAALAPAALAPAALAPAPAPAPVPVPPPPLPPVRPAAVPPPVLRRPAAAPGRLLIFRRRHLAVLAAGLPLRLPLELGAGRRRARRAFVRLLRPERFDWRAQGLIRSPPIAKRQTPNTAPTFSMTSSNSCFATSSPTCQ
jgi:hypothetical protein